MRRRRINAAPGHGAAAWTSEAEAALRHLPSELTALATACLEPADPDSLDSLSPELIEAFVPLLDRFARRWYRLEVRGMDLPPRGKAMVVINHDSGITFLEMLGLGARWYLERGTDDRLYGLGHDAMFRIPLVGNFLAHGGGVRASHANGDRVLMGGNKILVAPGGNLEAFRPFSQRKRIRFGGHKGFIRLALRNGAPICPAVFCGGHAGFVVLNDGRRLVELLGLHQRFRLDTFPLMLALPWGLALGPVFHLPLPVKVRVDFLEPIPTDHLPPGAEHDPAVVDRLYTLVTSRMQERLTRLWDERDPGLLGDTPALSRRVLELSARALTPG